MEKGEVAETEEVGPLEPGYVPSAAVLLSGTGKTPLQFSCRLCPFSTDSQDDFVHHIKGHSVLYRKLRMLVRATIPTPR